MSEEEAIAILKRVNQANRFDGLYSSVEIIFEAQKTLLNLIDKLQKELHQEKEKNNTYDIIKGNFIHKDKIRDKIKELEKSIEEVTYTEEQEEQQYRNLGFVITILNDLLEEE